MLIATKTWEINFELASLSLNTKFVQGIKNGDLPKFIFQKYVAQDYFFLECFARAYGLAISKCNNIKSIRTLSQLLLGVSEELILHENYARDWGINIKTNSIEIPTKNYTEFLDKISQNQSFIEILFAMTPCMRLYAWIGKSISTMTLNNPYKEWILTYSDSTFESLAESLENLINEYENSYDLENANSIYKKAMHLELDFFEEYSKF